MSRTYKRLPKGRGAMFRNVRGHSKLLKESEREEEFPIRKKAIPPDPWNDIQIDKTALLPYKICFDLLDQGVPEETVIKRIQRKFHISYQEVERIVISYKRIKFNSGEI